MLIQPLYPPLPYLHVFEEWKAKIIPRCKEDNVNIVNSCPIVKLDALALGMEPRDGRPDLDVRMSEGCVTESGQWFA